MMKTMTKRKTTSFKKAILWGDAHHKSGPWVIKNCQFFSGVPTFDEEGNLKPLNKDNLLDYQWEEVTWEEARRKWLSFGWILD